MVDRSRLILCLCVAVSKQLVLLKCGSIFLEVASLCFSVDAIDQFIVIATPTIKQAIPRPSSPIHIKAFIDYYKPFSQLRMKPRTPLKLAKQNSILPNKNNLTKETNKPKQVPSSAQLKTTHPSIINVAQKVEKKQNISKSPITTKRELPIKSVKQVKPKQSFPVMPEVKQQLHPCKDCGRTFVETALKRHQKICKKIFINKRKEFNSAKQRFASKDQLALYKKNKDKPDPLEQGKKGNSMPLWKQQSLAFRLAMKEMKGGKKTQEQLEFQQKEKKLTKSNMFKCKFCNRCFNQQAGTRHQNFCALKAKDMSNKTKDIAKSKRK